MLFILPARVAMMRQRRPTNLPAQRRAPSAMRRQSRWKTILPLKPGRYEYRFLKDGDWENDPSCAGCVPNEFESQNCVRIVE